ncbi:hypothetical protein [Bacteroides sp.]|uniref:hypothetical protein n=1 Tax=Bacteroides sp. TaxID=29523 RepID=UPI00261E597A|nr:hypothetical protein [Bacteroides sp.]
MKKRFILMPLFGIAILAACGAIVMLLWNFTLPAVCGLATINFWQALALFILARILFGGFPGRGGMIPGHSGMFPGRGGMFGGRRGNPFREKWEKMTPEERKKFIDKRRKFGFGNPWGKGPWGEAPTEDTPSENHTAETSRKDE